MGGVCPVPHHRLRHPPPLVPRRAKPPKRRRASLSLSARLPLRLGDLMRGWLGSEDAASLDITGVTADSRAVRQGMVFAALPGARADGRAFIADAVARGAAAILAPEGTAWPAEAPPRPFLTSPDPRRALALMAAAFYRVQPECVVAITGTNGKTSSVDFLRQIWGAAGRKKGSLDCNLTIMEPRVCRLALR